MQVLKCNFIENVTCLGIEKKVAYYTVYYEIFQIITSTHVYHWRLHCYRFFTAGFRHIKKKNLRCIEKRISANITVFKLKN